MKLQVSVDSFYNVEEEVELQKVQTKKIEDRKHETDAGCFI